ncbi:HAMP domain-containing sensor histidine kinase [Niveispirillum sp.]|uniref:sensor histidine kinase n=1 Tax=Niveispirillum sp. TaxID=1917217 RepID=UPI001B658520|nr:HAMP domain-containing sensor histidine kinase [Niveispirillum sp.]MBP7339011.1 HAMP domain-containing histidine kinase [Niveispirillum sp.]
MLVGIFVALPVVLYGQFEEADRKSRELVAESLRRDGWLVAQALGARLEQREDLPPAQLNAMLEKFADNGTILRLMFQPRMGDAAGGFFFVASAPRMPADQLGADLDLLGRHGILKSLGESCSWDKPVEIRYRQMDGAEEILTSVIPIQGRRGCWVLVSADNSSAMLNSAFGRPYWQTDNVRMAALIYLALAGLALLVAWRMRGALRHFRRVAGDIRRGGASASAFADRNPLPELASVAHDFDRLVQDLNRAAANIRSSAEDNAHSVKAPLAVIRSALQPLKNAVPADDQRSQRALQLIETALSRLSALISAAQRLGNDTADFIEAPKLRINLTQVVADALHNARDISSDRQIRFVRHLDDNVRVLAPEGILDIIMENILDNALGFCRPGGTITTTLTRSATRVDLIIDDEGPGVDPGKIEHIFDRNVSIRPPAKAPSGEPSHAGLGLWIVRHHVEAMGGTVEASNRAGGGLRMHVRLPRNNW